MRNILRVHANYHARPDTHIHMSHAKMRQRLLRENDADVVHALFPCQRRLLPYVDSLDPDQDRQNVGPDLDPIR